MNASECPPLFAVDTFFHQHSEGCSLNIVALIVTCELFALLHLYVALTRSKIISKNRSTRKSALNVWTWQSGLPYLTLFHSWGSFACIALTPLFWYFYNSSGGIILTVQFLFYALATELWLSKLIRLGARIIPKSASSSDESFPLKPERSEVAERLSNPDTVLRGLKLLDISLILIQAGCGIVAYSVTEDVLYVRISLGILAAISLSWEAATIWQYHRCENAIKSTHKDAEGMMEAETKIRSQKVMRAVISKMRMQRLTLTAFGSCGAVLLLLWTFGVIPIQWWLILFIQIFDAPPQAIIVFSMALRQKRPQPSALSSELGPAKDGTSVTSAVKQVAIVGQHEGGA